MTPEAAGRFSQGGSQFRVNALRWGLGAAGRNVVEWKGVNGQDVPVASGVYLVRLKTSEGEFKRRAVLLK